MITAALLQAELRAGQLGLFPSNLLFQVHNVLVRDGDSCSHNLTDDRIYLPLVETRLPQLVEVFCYAAVDQIRVTFARV